MARRRAYAAVLLTAVVLLAGCNGGTVDRHALKQDSDAIDSLACEGALVAAGVADGRTTTIFARVHSGELARAASNFEDALSERPATPSIEPRVRGQARHADLLETLHRNPSDADRAAGLQRRLRKAGDCP
jgi:hypothetical protein